MKGIAALVLMVAIPLPSVAAPQVTAPEDPAMAADELLWWTGRVRIPGEKRPLIPPWNLEGAVSITLGGGATAWILESGYGLRVLQGPGTWRTATRSFVGDRPPRGVPLEPAPGLDQTSPWRATPGLAPWRPDFRDGEPIPMRPIHTTTTTRSPSLSWATPTRKGEVTITLWRVAPSGELQLLENWRGAPGPTLLPWTTLEPGGAYLWRTRRQGPDGEDVAERLAPFAVISEDDASTLEGALRAIDTLKLQRGDAGCLRASVLTVFGLREEAVATWRAAAASGLGRPEIKPAVRRAMGIRVVHGARDAAMPPLPFGLRRD